MLLPGANRLFMVMAAACATLLLTATVAGAQDHDLFQKGTVSIEFGAAPLIETWTINEEQELMLETTASFWGAVSHRVALGAEFHHAWVFQSTPGAFVQGLSPLARIRLTERPRWNWYFEVGPGISWSDFVTPVRGTKFNYLFQGGTGLTRKMSSNTHLRIAYRFFHLSNHGREGKDHNPDLEMMGPFVAWSFSF